MLVVGMPFALHRSAKIVPLPQTRLRSGRRGLHGVLTLLSLRPLRVIPVVARAPLCRAGSGRRAACSRRAAG